MIKFVFAVKMVRLSIKDIAFIDRTYCDIFLDDIMSGDRCLYISDEVHENETNLNFINEVISKACDHDDYALIVIKEEGYGKSYVESGKPEIFGLSAKIIVSIEL